LQVLRRCRQERRAAFAMLQRIVEPEHKAVYLGSLGVFHDIKHAKVLHATIRLFPVVAGDTHINSTQMCQFRYSRIYCSRLSTVFDSTSIAHWRQ
jgi:hypothetical protein